MVVTMAAELSLDSEFASTANKSRCTVDVQTCVEAVRHTARMWPITAFARHEYG